MYYLKSRYYDPELRRFISADDQEVLTASPEIPADKNLFAYCDGNPLIRVDRGGTIWETLIDVVSLGASIVEVASNPGDPWAWAGMVGDVVDLVPCLTGVGETVRAIKTVNRVDKGVDNVIDAARTTYKMASKTSPIRQSTGSYEIMYKSGKNYVGKGGFKRAIKSAGRYANGHKLNNRNGDVVTSIRWKTAPNSRQAFIDEYYMQKNRGVLKDPNKVKPETYNLIWSPGRRYSGEYIPKRRR